MSLWGSQAKPYRKSVLFLLFKIFKYKTVSEYVSHMIIAVDNWSISWVMHLNGGLCALEVKHTFALYSLSTMHFIRNHGAPGGSLLTQQ